MFDREQLLLQQEGGVGPIPGWNDRPGDSIGARYWRTWYLILRHPVRFARRFPITWKYSSSIAYYRWTQAILAILVGGASAGVLIAGVILHRPEAIAVGILGLLLLLPLIMAVWWAELFVASLIEHLTRPKEVPRHVNQERIVSAWWDLIGYYASVFVPGLLLLMAIMTLTAFRGSSHTLMAAIVLIPVISYVYWCSIIIIAVWVRTRSNTRRLMAICLIFPTGLVGILIGLVFGGLMCVIIAIPLFGVLELMLMIVRKP